MAKLLSIFATALLLTTVASYGADLRHGKPGDSGHGGGSGRTKIDFKLSTSSTSSSRILAKFDVTSGAIALLPETGSKSLNDNLAGFRVFVTLNTTTVSGAANSKGQVVHDSETPFDAKIVANGKGLQVSATGLDLVTILGLDTTDGNHTVTVPITVVAEKIDTNTVTTTLASVSATFKYSVKNGSIKGKN